MRSLSLSPDPAGMGTSRVFAATVLTIEFVTAAAAFFIVSDRAAECSNIPNGDPAARHGSQSGCPLPLRTCSRMAAQHHHLESDGRDCFITSDRLEVPLPNPRPPPSLPFNRFYRRGCSGTFTSPPWSLSWAWCSPLRSTSPPSGETPLLASFSGRAYVSLASAVRPAGSNRLSLPDERVQTALRMT